MHQIVFPIKFVSNCRIKTSKSMNAAANVQLPTYITSSKDLPKSQELKEFQKFLRRACTLQMPSNDGKNGINKGNIHIISNTSKISVTQHQQYLPLSAPVEYGIEPSTIMDSGQYEEEVYHQPFATNSTNVIKSVKQQMLEERLAVAPPATNIRVTVGIDKDLEMILEMDPSIVDLGDICWPSSDSYKPKGLTPLSGGPTFKTAVPTSRTQLKLQLQREQQQQELERRQAERRSDPEKEHLQQQNQNEFDRQFLSPQLHRISKAHILTDSPTFYTENSLIDGLDTSSEVLSYIQPMELSHISLASSGLTVTNPVAMAVPITNIGVDVPPQVLQVHTVLENPTRYHVMQKQKNQVRQFLNESFKPAELNSIQHRNRKKSMSNGNSMREMQSTCKAENRNSENKVSPYRLQVSPKNIMSIHDDYNQSSPLDTNSNTGSFSTVARHQQQQRQYDSFKDFEKVYRSSDVINSNGNSIKIIGESTGRIGGLVNFLRGGGSNTKNNSIAPAPMSPSLSSVATSNSEGDDIFDDILQIDSSALHDSFKLDSNCTSDLSIKQEPQSLTDAEMHAMAKDRQKKDNHNMNSQAIIKRPLRNCGGF